MGVHKAEHRPAELCRELHHAQSFPVAFRLRLPEIAREPLLGVASFLVPDHRDGPPVVFGKTGDNGLVVGVPAVAMQLHEIREQEIHVVQCVGPLLVPRNLSALPRSQMRIEFFSQLRDFLADTLQLHVRHGIAVPGKAPQFLDVFLKMFDDFLALDLLLIELVEFVFFLRSHAPTEATA